MTDSLEAVLARQEQEHQALITVAVDELDQRLAVNAAALDAAARSDDEAALAVHRKAREGLVAERSSLAERAEHKGLAVVETKRRIVARDRAAAIRELIAHARTASDIAEEVAAQVETLAETLSRFRGQLAGAYTTFAPVSPSDAATLGRLTSVQWTWDDAAYALRVALGLPNAPPPRGTAEDQAALLRDFSETVR